MTTTVFNLSAVDRIEADCKQILSNQAASQQNETAIINALAALMKIVTDFVTAVGGGDQPSIDAATAALQTIQQTLVAATERDKAP